MHELAIVPQILVAVSISFMWVVRYDSINQEFRQCGLQDWLRDLVAVPRRTFSLR